MNDSKSLVSYAKCFALRPSGRQVAARSAAPDWLSGQAARCCMAATRVQRGVLGI
jgi:hypothetical protein